MAEGSDIQARVSNASLASKVLLAGALVFFIDSFLAWQSVDFGPVSATASGWHGVGIIAALCAIAILAIEGARLFGVRLPLDSLLEARIVAALAGAVLLFTIIKIINDDFGGYARWIGLIVGIVLVGGGLMRLAEPKRSTA